MESKCNLPSICLYAVLEVVVFVLKLRSAKSIHDRFSNHWVSHWSQFVGNWSGFSDGIVSRIWSRQSNPGWLGTRLKPLITQVSHSTDLGLLHKQTIPNFANHPKYYWVLDFTEKLLHFLGNSSIHCLYFCYADIARGNELFVTLSLISWCAFDD